MNSPDKPSINKGRSKFACIRKIFK